MTLLVLEYSRKRHMPLFVLNIMLILYAVYGYVVPGMFYHAGLSWQRVVTAMSVEIATGVFSNLPQIALTVIGAFLLVLSTLQRLRLHRIAAARDQARRDPLAARAAAVGGDRLDVRRHGERQRRRQRHHHRLGHHSRHDRRRHAARDRGGDRESASSLGGQLMPPVMGVAAFLMAEFLGKSYFDVVARGYVPALIYYATVAVSVYLLATAPSHASGRRPIRQTLSTGATVVNLARLPRRDLRPGRHDGRLISRAAVRRALRVRRGRRRVCSSSTRVSLLRPGHGRSREFIAPLADSSTPISR